MTMNYEGFQKGSSFRKVITLAVECIDFYSQSVRTVFRARNYDTLACAMQTTLYFLFRFLVNPPVRFGNKILDIQN